MDLSKSNFRENVIAFLNWDTRYHKYQALISKYERKLNFMNENKFFYESFKLKDTKKDEPELILSLDIQ